MIGDFDPEGMTARDLLARLQAGLQAIADKAEDDGHGLESGQFALAALAVGIAVRSIDEGFPMELKYFQHLARFHNAELVPLGYDGDDIMTDEEINNIIR